MTGRTRSSATRSTRTAATNTTNITTTKTNATTTKTAAAATPRGPPNLFRNQLSRRPTASSTNSAETLRLDPDAASASASDSSDIVVRDQHGEIEVDNPPTPVVDDEDELAALEDRREMEGMRQRLAEAVRHHQASRSSVTDEPEELLEAVRASLRAKVAALAEDNWMFEPEDQTRG